MRSVHHITDRACCRVHHLLYMRLRLASVPCFAALTGLALVFTQLYLPALCDCCRCAVYVLQVAKSSLDDCLWALIKQKIALLGEMVSTDMLCAIVHFI
jgi:hypothetical protein